MESEKMTIQKKIEEAGAKPVWIWTNDVDDISIEQLTNVAKLSFVFDHVAAMPDVHAGLGATIGSVIATEKAVIPAAVGVDIGCGMLAVKTNLTKDDLSVNRLEGAMREILRRTPVGMRQHKEKNVKNEMVALFAPEMEDILKKTPDLLSNMRKMTWQAEIGTLGAGNHFIELTADETGALWVMLHSGSRGAGNTMAVYYISKARKLMQELGIELPDPALAFFEEGTELFDDYMRATDWAQRYAAVNRIAMLEDIAASLKGVWPNFTLEGDVINCHHNYVEKETHLGKEVYVTRKGAIRAKAGEAGIIPGSMGTNSYLVTGLGNPDSFMSSSHGAGRKMSRTAARNTFTKDDLEKQTAGVVCRKDIGVVDEIPAAYKDIEAVIANQSDLTKVNHTLKQVLCIKG